MSKQGRGTPHAIATFQNYKQVRNRLGRRYIPPLSAPSGIEFHKIFNSCTFVISRKCDNLAALPYLIKALTMHLSVLQIVNHKKMFYYLKQRKITLLTTNLTLKNFVTISVSTNHVFRTANKA